MKYFYFSIIGLLFISCKKDDDSFTNGEATAILNSVPWEAETWATTSPAYPGEYIGMSALVFNGNGYRRESLAFSKIPLEVGRFDVGNKEYPHDYPYVGMAYYTVLSDGDVVGDVYIVDTMATGNYCEVISFDAGKKEIEIEFEAVFLLDGRHHEDAPDTLIFENGYIKTKIDNY